jgi:hypothetical protein
MEPSGSKWNLHDRRGFQEEPTTDGSKWSPQPAAPLGTAVVQSKNHLEMVPHRTKKGSAYGTAQRTLFGSI